jgi:hypothetical protein
VLDDFSRFVWIILLKSKPEVSQYVQNFIVLIQQNGRVECKHQHLLNVGQALLFQSKLPKSFWSYAISYATFIINHVLTPLLNNKCPYQLLYDSLPDLSQIKVFGSLCFASTLQNHRTKLSCRAGKSFFLGYAIGFKGSVLPIYLQILILSPSRICRLDIFMCINGF